MNESVPKMKLSAVAAHRENQRIALKNTLPEDVSIFAEGSELIDSGVMKAFASHILHGTPLVADVKEGIRGLMLSNAMHLSSWLGQTIALPFDEDLFYKELQKRCKNSAL